MRRPSVVASGAVGWVRLPLALLAAAALAARGDDGAPETRTAPPAMLAAPEDREPVRAAPPAEELPAKPTAAQQHALDVLLRRQSDDDAREAAIDAVPVVLRRLRGTPRPVERAGLLLVLRSAWRRWTGTELAPQVVAAAWSAAEAADASQEDDFGACAAVVGVLSRAGALPDLHRYARDPELGKAARAAIANIEAK